MVPYLLETYKLPEVSVRAIYCPVLETVTDVQVLSSSVGDVANVQDTPQLLLRYIGPPWSDTDTAPIYAPDLEIDTNMEQLASSAWKLALQSYCTLIDGDAVDGGAVGRVGVAVVGEAVEGR